MNKIDYEKKIVINKNCFFTCSVDNIQLIITQEDYKKWDMKIFYQSTNYVLYNAGYVFCEQFSYNYINYHKFKWLHGYWLPNWGILTLQKANLLNNIKKYFLIKNLNLIFNFPSEINNIVINFIL